MAEKFPTYFASLYPHMVLVEETVPETVTEISSRGPDKVFLMIPPNQMDWHFTLTNICEDEWEVHGMREYDFGFDTPWEYKVIYKWDSLNNCWKTCSNE